MGQIGHLSNSSQVSYSYINSLKCTQISGRQMQELKSLPYMSFWSNNSVNLSHFSQMFSHEKPRYQIKPCCWSRSYIVFKCLHEDVALNVVQKYFYSKMNNYRYKTCRGTVTHLSKLSHRPLSMGVITINT